MSIGEILKRGNRNQKDRLCTHVIANGVTDIFIKTRETNIKYYIKDQFPNLQICNRKYLMSFAVMCFSYFIH